MTTSLVLVDLQYDFMNYLDPAGVGRLNKAMCLPGVRKALIHARAQQWQIVHVITRHEDGNSLPQRLRELGRSPYCVGGTQGCEIIRGLAAPEDIIVEKKSYDGFLNTELSDVLAATPNIVMAGLAADCCILFTAQSAASACGKQVYLPYQAIAASSVEDYLFGLRTAAKSFAAVVDLEMLVAAGSLSEDLDLFRHCQTYEEKCRKWFLDHEVDLKVLDNENPSLRERPIEETLEKMEESIS